MAIDRRLLFNVDWVLLGATLLLCAAGVATILSATQTGRFAGLYVKQLYLLLAGLAALTACLVVDYRRLADRSPVLYLLTVGVLGWLLVIGPRVAGARRWILLGSFQLQPSEIAKLVAALLVAKMFSEERRESLGLVDVALPGAAVGLLALLIGLAAYTKSMGLASSVRKS